MKLLFILVILFATIAGALFYFGRRYIGDIRPSTLPSTRTISVGAGKPLQTPLVINGNFTVGIFADHIPGARDIAFSQWGTMLVSSTSTGAVYVVADIDKNGIGDEPKQILVGLNRPHGLLFRDNILFVAEESSVKRYVWDENTQTAIEQKEILSLPAGGRHFTRSMDFDKDGKLYITIGSTCDVCIEKDPRLASVIVTDENGTNPRVFSKGLRNATFIKLNESSNQMWVTEMGRDFLGDESPPDEINILTDGGDYGWPYCYGDQVFDTSFNVKDPSYCRSTIPPIYKIAAHSAPLGLVFIHSSQFPSSWQGDLLVAYHGSWNRSTPIGYKVVHLKVQDNRILGEEDFLSGFLQGADAVGRPVDLEFDKDGTLYISDDKGGIIYKVVKK